MTTPKKLAIYYGWPSAVNATFTVPGAISVFQDYDLVVLGAGLENPSHGDHANTVDIIAGLPGTTKVFGYIDSEASNSTNWLAIDRWVDMGVAGIFCDKFGYDYNVDRNRQNVLVEYTHYKGKTAFVNAWDPDDVFANTVNPTKNPLGTANMVEPTDWYLSESFQIVNGAYQDEAFWKAKSDKMAGYMSLGQMACVTTYDNSAFDQAKFDYAFYSSVLYGFGAFGWGEEFYSASSAQLPFRTRPPVYGDSFVNGISEPVSGTFQRNTNVGVLVNTTTHTVDTVTI